MRLLRSMLLLLLLTSLPACVLTTILRRNVVALLSKPRRVQRLEHVERPGAAIALLWVGHATMLVQIEDRFILTDPVFTETVGGAFSRRLVETGIAVENLPALDLALVSHMHFDHLSLGSLDRLESRLPQLLLPQGGLVYMPRYHFAVDEVKTWQSVERRGLRITAVPVRHEGFRYGADAAWMTTSATGWMLQYRGKTVYFAGDTAYDRKAFLATAARFPQIDVAILPIAPVEPPNFARPSHLDGREALQAFLDLRAKHMVPMHFDTFAHGIDPKGYATRKLREAMQEMGIDEERVHILPIGGQFVLPEAARGEGPQAQLSSPLGSAGAAREGSSRFSSGPAAASVRRTSFPSSPSTPLR